MDEKTLEQRTKTLLFLLSCEDPKYPNRNFHQELLRSIDERQQVSVVDAAAILREAVQTIVTQNSDNQRWSEIINSYFSSDIYDALASVI